MIIAHLAPLVLLVQIAAQDAKLTEEHRWLALVRSNFA
jgi:hypothetical protein